MPVHCQDYNQICVLRIEGDLAGEEVPKARKVLEDAIEQKQIVDFVIDMEQSPFVDSEGLEALLWMKRRCEEHFGQFKVARLDDTCQKILQITRLDHRLECHANLEEAMKTMR